MSNKSCQYPFSKRERVSFLKAGSAISAQWRASNVIKTSRTTGPLFRGRYYWIRRERKEFSKYLRHCAYFSGLERIQNVTVKILNTCLFKILVYN
jgi:hypothetical protein